ncbi:MAG: hypothetical protein HYR89_11745 [Actinobacteria bacterium]|nr:hypothetical protein [Actinomycetota bacterium]
MGAKDEWGTPQPERKDPVIVRRERFSRWAKIGNRVGYGLFLISLLSFIYGSVFTFTDAVSIIATICLITGSFVLMPAIILGYAVKAAERDDREHGR